eukprot:g2586.t1
MTGAILCIIAALLVAVSHARISLEDLQGEYMAQIVFPTIVSLTEEGRVTNFCRERFTPECLEEVGLPVERVVIENGTISFTIIQSNGITSRNASIEAYPSCAPGGMYPFEFIGSLPPAEIQSYDPTTGHLTFIFETRPDDISCAIITLEEGKEGRSLRAKYILSSENLPELQTVALGPTFRCVAYNDLCIAETSVEGNFVSLVDVDFQIPCVTGHCMDSKRK